MFYSVWADSGECNVNPRYMLVYCAKACNICHYQGDLAQLMHDRLVEKKLEEEKALQLQKTQYGMEQTITDEASQTTYDAMINYMQNVVAVDPKFERVRDECKMRSENCVFWASIGECNKTREYMIVQCAPACQTCDMLDFSNRCPYDPQEPTALQPGDLHAFFERLILRQEYNPTILSQPQPTSPDILEGPWVVTLDQFLTDEECDRLIQMGQEVGYLESADVGKQKFDGKVISS
jgi:prolyl 4-hydroxylase